MKDWRATGTELIGVFQDTSELVFALSFIIDSTDFAVKAAVDKANRPANNFKTISSRSYFC
jgi:hypothetical protein